MKWPRWSIAAANSGDPLPLVFGAIFLFISLPGFLMVLFNSGREAGTIQIPLLFVLGGGMIIGVIFVIFGLRICSAPGSLVYRITHGRIFSR